MPLTRLTKDKIKNDIIKLAEEISGENFMACYQCGRCSAGCPMVSEMDLLPNEVLRYAQLGLGEAILDSKTIWVCSSCFTCSVRCPKGIDIARVMEAFRQIKLRKNQDYIPIKLIPKKELENMPQIALVSSFRKLTS
ncbi:MAG: 4Fe-4S dicluster domain-containing protein [Candidatus Asgardarchaeia archaeon]